MGSGYSQEKFTVAADTEAIIDGNIRDLVAVMKCPLRKKKLKKLLIKKDFEGRTLIHLVCQLVFLTINLKNKNKT